MRTVWGIHSSRRTRLAASLNASSGFECQIAVRGADVCAAYRSRAHTVTWENSPSNAGVVRAIPGFDFCTEHRRRVGAHLLKGDLNRPAADESAQTFAGSASGAVHRNVGPDWPKPRRTSREHTLRVAGAGVTHVQYWPRCHHGKKAARRGTCVRRWAAAMAKCCRPRAT